jgi:eukaryotic-like serine/threonine-protein kinase
VSDADNPLGESLPRLLGVEIEQVCDDFEAAWKAGRRPRLEGYLLQVRDSSRAVLVCNLLTVELAYRRRAGEQPTPEEYAARFPQYAELLPTIFRQARPTPPAPDPHATRPPASGTGTPRQAEPTVAAPATPPRPGAANWPRVPGYEIVAELGRGGMGVVYKAVQVRLKRFVALKMIRDGALAGPEQVQRFRREAEVVARFQHPNLVRIYDVGEWQGHPYFAMEFAEGGGLDRRLTGRPLPVRDAAELIRTLAEAMHYAHQKHVVHRDLKPANVLLTEDGRPMIADFGLAKQLDAGPGDTPSEAVLGTASYMAPEQAKGKVREVGPAADVYALGAILYALLTGRPPFKGETWYETVHRVLTEEPVPPGRLRAEVPPALEAVCLTCLAKAPDRRYPSAHALADELRRFLSGEATGSAAPSGGGTPVPGYEILAVLGRSATNTVFKARQLSLDRVVALRVFGPGASSGEFEHRTSVARMLAAYQAAARAQHPNLLSIHDCGVLPRSLDPEPGAVAGLRLLERLGPTADAAEELVYVATEFLDGVKLSAKIRDTPQAPREAARLVATLARAVHYAHQQGIIHRALRPGAIWLTPAGIPKIGGFELAKLLGRASHEGEEEGSLVGIATHMAPEQFLGRMGAIGPPTDLYALGLVLFEALTGQPFRRAEFLANLCWQVVHTEPEWPQVSPVAVPGELQGICLRCLQRDPADRFADAAQLADALERFLQAPHRPPDGGPSRPLWARVTQWVKGRPKGEGQA